MIWLEFEFYSQYNIGTLDNKFKAYLNKIKDQTWIKYIELENEWYTWMREFKMSVDRTSINRIKEFIKKIRIKIWINNQYLRHWNNVSTGAGIRWVHMHIFDETFKKYYERLEPYWDNIYDILYINYLKYKMNNVYEILEKEKEISDDLILTYYSEIYRLVAGHQILFNMYYRKDLIYEDDDYDYDDNVRMDTDLKELYDYNNICFKYWRTFWYDRWKYNPVMLRKLIWMEPSIEFRMLDTTDLYNIPQLQTMFTEIIETFDWTTNKDYVPAHTIVRYIRKLINMLNELKDILDKRDIRYTSNYILINKLLNENEKILKAK